MIYNYTLFINYNNRSQISFKIVKLLLKLLKHNKIYSHYTLENVNISRVRDKN